MSSRWVPLCHTPVSERWTKTYQNYLTLRDAPCGQLLERSNFDNGSNSEYNLSWRIVHYNSNSVYINALWFSIPLEGWIRRNSTLGFYAENTPSPQLHNQLEIPCTIFCLYPSLTSHIHLFGSGESLDSIGFDRQN